MPVHAGPAAALISLTLLAGCSGGGGDSADEGALDDGVVIEIPPLEQPRPEGAPDTVDVPTTDGGATPSPTPDGGGDAIPEPVPEPEPEAEPETAPEAEPEATPAPQPAPAEEASALCADARLDGVRFCVDRATRLFSATAADGSTAWSFALPGDNVVADVVALGDTVYLLAANVDGSLERSAFEPDGTFVDTRRLFEALDPAALTFSLPREGGVLALDDGFLALSGASCRADGERCRAFVAVVDPDDGGTEAWRETGAPGLPADVEVPLPTLDGLELDGRSVRGLEFEVADGTSARWVAATLVDGDALARPDTVADVPEGALEERSLERAGRWLVSVVNDGWAEPLLDDVDELVSRIETDAPADPIGTGRPANPVSGSVACDGDTSARWARENTGSFADRYEFRLDGCTLGEATLFGGVERLRGDGGVRVRGSTVTTSLDDARRDAPDGSIGVMAGSFTRARTVSSGTVGETGGFEDSRDIRAGSFDGGPEREGAAVGVIDSSWSSGGTDSPPGLGSDDPPTSAERLEGRFEATVDGAADGAGSWTLATEEPVRRERERGGAWRPAEPAGATLSITAPGGARLDAEPVARGAWRYRFSPDGGPDVTWRIVPGEPDGSFLDGLWADCPSADTGCAVTR